MSRPTKDAIIEELWALVRHQSQLIQQLMAAVDAPAAAVTPAPAASALGFERLAQAAYATDGPIDPTDEDATAPPTDTHIAWQKPPKKDAEA